MNAADLPQSRHETPIAMARSLATYMADPVRIQRAVRAEFGTSPCKGEISALRAQFIRQGSRNPYTTSDGINPLLTVEAELKSTSFLAALMREHPERFAVAAE